MIRSSSLHAEDDITTSDDNQPSAGERLPGMWKGSHEAFPANFSRKYSSSRFRFFPGIEATGNVDWTEYFRTMASLRDPE